MKYKVSRLVRLLPYRITLFLFFTIACLTSCKLHKERQQQKEVDQHSEQQVKSYHISTQSWLLDSNQRHWSFWTDGWLHYHPDSGLRSQGGTLSLRESTYSKHSQEQEEEIKQATSAESLQLHVQDKSKRSTKTHFNFWRILLFVLITVYLVYKLIWRK